MQWRSKRQTYSQSKQNPFQNRTTLLRGASFFKTMKANSSSVFAKSKISQYPLDVENYFTSRAHSAKYTSMSSTCWSLYDQNANIQLGFRHFKQREVASLTKIMTTLIGLQLKEEHSIYSNMLVKITEGATKNIGTTAGLKRYNWICLKDIFYGIMLPSGNDAAHLLSQVMGYILVNIKKEESFNPSKLNILDLTKESTAIYIAQFVKHMNLKAQQLGLTMTRYSNPHGLQNAMNLSTAKDILTLSIAAAKNNKFRTVMNAQIHRYYVYRVEETGTIRQPKHWENTNILLAEGWQGIKTGQTNAAGGCLASLKNGIFIVILNCPDSSTRFRETKRLYSWYIEQGKHLRQTLCSSTDSFQF